MSDDLRVVGGVGGTRAQLDDLERCAAALTALAGTLGELRGPLARLTRTVDDATQVSPGTAPRARAAVVALGSGRTGVPGLATSAQDMAERLRRAARGYRDAEAAVTGLMRRFSVTAAHTLGEAGPVAWAGAAGVALPFVVAGGTVLTRLAALRLLAQTPTPPGMVLASMVQMSGQRDGVLARLLGGPGLLPRLRPPGSAVLEPVVAGIAAFVVGAAPGRHPVPGGLVPWPGADRQGAAPTPVREAAHHLRGPSHLASHVLHGPSTLVVTPQPVVGRGARRADPPRDAADLVAGIADVYPASSAPPGTVAVHRLERPSGEASWVVTIPGTQSGSLTGGTVPSDMASNLDLMAGHRDDVSTLARTAMAQAGIPPGEPVQIVGHSQGGIAAVAVANDPDVLAAYDVRTVVTVGSPVGALTVPDDVAALHVETTTDAVPAADGVAPPDRPNRTTVTVDLTRSDDPGLRAAALTVTGAHEVDTYAAVTARLAESDHPSVVHALGTVDELLGGPGTSMTTQWFTGERLPLDRPPDHRGVSASGNRG